MALGFLALAIGVVWGFCLLPFWAMLIVGGLLWLSCSKG